ncbi:hypothetical protein GCM10023188_27520 [Pontibacter saemangeumensis]|uniref:Metallo-beta-lactamase domain-containing protein n=1 Tax=Pontibacter saemangeumensis TaxID=1084525 RepID=A0ABP8LS88_9BACT
MANPVKYLQVNRAKIYKDPTLMEEMTELLWGDRVEVLSLDERQNQIKVKARWVKEGYIHAKTGGENVLGDKPLLELYFIDVGQGDGVLVVTPDREHILIDGGYPRDSQPHGKSAADFVDWKYIVDYGERKIVLDAMISSHCDYDHYGGLWDLLSLKQKHELEADEIEIKRFYHAGVSWWKSTDEERFLGRTEDGYLVDLLEGKASVDKGLSSGSDLRLQGKWAEFIKCIADSGTTIDRLAYNPENGFDYLPGFEDEKPVKIKVLGPIERTINGKAALKELGKPSQNTNGNSILLRLDYGRAKILLTGDLNKNSQQYILEAFKGNRQELAADVVKACHHGSDDCSFEFLESVQAAVTIISSGDDESHAHPRPNIVAASGITGFKTIRDDEMITPLVYNTEIARSLRMGRPFKITHDDFSSDLGEVDIEMKDMQKARLSYKVTPSGALSSKSKTKPLNKLRVIDGIVYGLVNIRTDGDKILCATLNESKQKWDIKTFSSRF